MLSTSVGTVRFEVGSSQEQVGTSLQDVRFGFRSGYMLEIVELSSPASVLHTFVFPLAPQKYELGDPYAVVLTPTMAGTVVAEENGVLMQDITLEGTFGLRKRKKGISSGAQQAGADRSGTEHFSGLREFFREYSRRKKNPALGYKTQMRFHSFREDDHFVVTPKMFSQPRDSKSTRMHYAYRIQMTAIATSEAPETVNDDTGNFFEDAGAAISAALNDARAAFQEVNAKLSQAKRYAQNIETVVIQAAGLITSVAGMVRGTTELINYPIKLAMNVADDIERAVDDMQNALYEQGVSPLAEVASVPGSLKKLELAFTRIGCFPERFQAGVEDALRRIENAYAGERRLTQDDIDNGTAGADEGSRLRAFGDASAYETYFPRFSSANAVRVDSTTTLAGLEARYDVPAALIIVVNDLRPPYFAPGGGPGILGPGDSVLIPVLGSGPAAPGSGSYGSAEEMLYGSDLALDMDHYRETGRFELKVDNLHGGGDAEIVRGLPNVVQGMSITVDTERGATIYIPSLGVFRSVGVKGTLDKLLLASLYLSDSRIERIEKMEVVIDGDVLSQEITPRLIGGRNDATFVRPFGRVSGGS